MAVKETDGGGQGGRAKVSALPTSMCSKLARRHEVME
jgi:hypothetical protein